MIMGGVSKAARRQGPCLLIEDSVSSGVSGGRCRHSGAMPSDGASDWNGPLHMAHACCWLCHQPTTPPLRHCRRQLPCVPVPAPHTWVTGGCELHVARGSGAARAAASFSRCTSAYLAGSLLSVGVKVGMSSHTPIFQLFHALRIYGARPQRRKRWVPQFVGEVSWHEVGVTAVAPAGFS
jgi:hypothetical protein